MLLARVLTDPATGLPSVAYFGLIREWEERKAGRNGGHVRVLCLRLTGGSERIRKTMGWRLCGEFRTSDLIASNGPGDYRILLTSPDADHADAIAERMLGMEAMLNALDPDAPRVHLEVDLEPERVRPARGPCELPEHPPEDDSGDAPRGNSH